MDEVGARIYRVRVFPRLISSKRFSTRSAPLGEFIAENKAMKKEISKLLSDSKYGEAAAIVKDMPPEEAAKILNAMDEEHVLPFSRELESDFLAETLVLLDTERQKRILDGLRDDELKDVMDEVSVDDTVELIEDMPGGIARRIAEKEEILKLLEERNFSVLKPLVSSMNEVDVAALFEDVGDEELPVLFRLLPKDTAAETFVEMDRDVKEKLLHKLNDVEVKAVMDELFLDDTVDLVEEMPANVVKRLLAQSDGETRSYINEILKYPKDSAGSVMTIEYVSLRPTMTVAEAFDRIRGTAIDKETIYNCYVTDVANKLIGLVSAKDLMLAAMNEAVGNIMEENVIYVHTTDDKEDVARKISNYGFLAIPVVDRETRLVGIVTVDDAMDVLQEENTEDIAKMAAITPTDKPYLKTGVFAIWKNRIPWLLVLMISATFTGLILNTYEERLSAISTVLFACVPMIMDTGGNAGSQASVTVIRSLALGELSTKDVLKVVWKELRVSLLLGATLALACFAKLTLIDRLLFGYSGYTVLTCVVISLALLCTVVVAKLVGCALPLLAKKCRLDPAVVASPFITTIVDAVSLMLYCSLAIAVLA